MTFECVSLMKGVSMVDYRKIIQINPNKNAVLETPE